MKNMNLGKVLTFVTKEDDFSNSDYVITPIPAYRTPEMEFTRLGLMGRIKSYEVSAVMPLTVAVTFAMQKVKALEIKEMHFIKW